MPDELDIVRMERRKTSYATVTANLVHRAFLHHAADDIGICLAEIHRLRALVATEHAKTAHARAWAEWHHVNGDIENAPQQLVAIDGWDGNLPPGLDAP